MLLGNLYYDHGQVEQSIPYFEYVTQNTTDSLKKTMSLYSWGYALENTHHCDQAIKKYEQALSLGEVSMKQDLTQAKQRCQK
jgi:tetratricopeptide (TPR) repeat protein